MKFFVQLIAVLWLVLPFSANSAEKTVKVGLIYGEAAVTTSGISTILLGGRLAVDDLNHQGGLLGRPIELIELDNGNTPLGSRLAAEKAAKIGVIAVIGPTTSSHALLAGAVLQESKIPMISTISTNPEVTLLGDYIFSICFSDRFQGQALAAFAVQEPKAKTAVVLTCSGEKYSIGLAEIFMDHYRKNGGITLWEGDYLNTSTDFRELLEKVRLYHPDIIFLPGYNRASGFIIKQCRNMQIGGTFLGGDAWTNHLHAYGGEAINGNYYVRHWNIDSEDKLSQAFVSRYKDVYQDVEIESFGPAHDALLLLADAVSRAKSLEPALIREALATTTNFQGVTGTITMDKNGDAIKPIAIFKFEKGASVFVKTIMP